MRIHPQTQDPPFQLFRMLKMLQLAFDVSSSLRLKKHFCPLSAAEKSALTTPSPLPLLHNHPPQVPIVVERAQLRGVEAEAILVRAA